MVKLETEAHSIECEITARTTFTTPPNPHRPTGCDPVERLEHRTLLEGEITLSRQSAEQIGKAGRFSFAGREWELEHLTSVFDPDATLQAVVERAEVRAWQVMP